MKKRAIVLLLIATVSIAACVTENTYNKEVSLADTYQRLNANFKLKSVTIKRRSRSWRTWSASPSRTIFYFPRAA